MSTAKQFLFGSIIIWTVIGIFSSCTKISDPDVEKYQEVIPPVGIFTITFSPNGTFLTNNEAFLESYPQMKKAFTTLSGNLCKKKDFSNTTFSINPDGTILSDNPEYNGKDIVAVLISEGQFSYFKNDLVITFDKDGYKKISNEEIYQMFPQLKERFVNMGNNLKSKVPEGKKLEVTYKNDGSVLLNGVNADFSKLGSSGLSKAATKVPCTYEDFKDCVGYWWFLPGVNVIMCGIVCIIMDLIYWIF